MNRIAIGTFALALSALLVPAAALAKGASEAEIAGPGLASPIALGGSGEPGSGEELGGIAEAAGFFAAVFGQSPNPLVAKRPQGDLGPRYTITYLMPGPNNEEDTLVQDIYPYAQPHPVTYTEPGQRFWTTERTRGGWFVAYYTSLKDQLVSAGLPEQPPAGGNGDADRLPWLTMGALTVLVVVALVAVPVAAVRRRPRSAAAS